MNIIIGELRTPGTTGARGNAGFAEGSSVHLVVVRMLSIMSTPYSCSPGLATVSGRVRPSVVCAG